MVREAEWLLREGIEEFDVLEAGHLDQDVMDVLRDRLVRVRCRGLSGSPRWRRGIVGMTENCAN